MEKNLSYNFDTIFNKNLLLALFNLMLRVSQGLFHLWSVTNTIQNFHKMNLEEKYQLFSLRKKHHTFFIQFLYKKFVICVIFFVIGVVRSISMHCKCKTVQI